jgi:predicted transposase YbfD/YdcC
LAFAATPRLLLGQEAVCDKSNELNAIAILVAQLTEQGCFRGALVSIDAIATNGTIVTNIKQSSAEYLLAVKANQPALRAKAEACFDTAPPGTLDTDDTHNKRRGRVEQRIASVVREVDELSRDHRFPGEFRLPGIA